MVTDCDYLLICIEFVYIDPAEILAPASARGKHSEVRRFYGFSPLCVAHPVAKKIASM